MNTFSLKIYTVDHTFYDGECESLIIPTTDGPYGIMAHHTNMVAALASGELDYREKGSTDFEHIAVAPGIVTVAQNEVTVLVETAEKASDIDIERAKKQYERAKSTLTKEGDPLARRIAEANLSRAITRMKVRSGKKY